MHPRQIVVAALFGAFAIGCGGDGGSDGGTEPPPPPPPPPSGVGSVIVVAPKTQAVPSEEVQLTAVVQDQSGTELRDEPVTWTTSAPAIATVSEAGLVTALAAGTATIAARSGEMDGAVQLTVREGGRVGPEGGILTAFGGTVRLEVPAGAVSSPLSITVDRVDQPSSDPSTVRATGFIVAPQGMALAVPATLSIGYEPGEGPGGVPEFDLRIHRFGAAGRESVGGAVDAAVHVASAPVTALGMFAVARAPAETPCTEPEYRQFDFWLGAWSVTVAAAQVGTPPAPSDITLEAGGCAVFENFGNGVGRSVNVYNPADARWHQTYAFGTGPRLLLVGGLEGDAMVLTRELPNAPPGSFDRWTWTRLPGGRVRQVNEVSTDGGATVTTGFDGTYAPR
jgi:hypothetical protein